jgi:hypothetical protein
VTSRLYAVASSPHISCWKEVRVFSRDDSAEFLRATVDRQEYTDSEKESSKRLAEILDGLPLALMVMGNQIRLKPRTIGKFVSDYEVDFARAHRPQGPGSNMFYHHTLATVYQKSFENLSNESASLLGIMCFVAPQHIPCDMFTAAKEEWLGDILSFCATPFGYVPL